MKLSPHEQKILELIKEFPDILTNPKIREEVAIKNGMTEKTLRNRIGDLKRYGLISASDPVEKPEMPIQDDFSRNLLFIWNKRKFILINLSIVAGTSLIVSLLLPKWYTSQAIILSSDTGKFSLLSSISPLPVSELGLSNVQDDISKFIAIINSNTVKSQMVDRFDLINRYDAKDIEYAMQSFEENLELQVTEEGALKISVLDKDPQTAKDMIDELLRQLDKINQKLGMDKGFYNREFLENRLNQARTDLANAEIALRDFQQRTGIVDIASQIAAQYEAYGQLYTQEMLAYSELYSLRAQTEVQLNVATATLNPDNPMVNKYNVMLDEQNKQLQEITADLDKHLKEAILGLKENQNQQNKLELGQTPGMIAFKTFPDLAMENVRLVREVTIQNQLLELLLPQYETAKLEESKSIPTLQIIEAPRVAINKTKPKRALIVLASVMMGLILSVMYIYTESYFLDLKTHLKTSNVS